MFDQFRNRLNTFTADQLSQACNEFGIQAAGKTKPHLIAAMVAYVQKTPMTGAGNLSTRALIAAANRSKTADKLERR